MRKASVTNKVLLRLSAFFLLLAIISFAAFQEAEGICSEAENCSKVLASSRGEMIWDAFYRQLISFVSYR